MEVRTLNDIYAVTCTLDRPAALKSKRDGRWVDVTVPEFRDAVRYFATGLRILGIKPGDRVAILSENRPEWAISDFAILANAAVTVPVYPTLLGWQIEYILNDSGAVAVICSTPPPARPPATAARTTRRSSSVALSLIAAPVFI